MYKVNTGTKNFICFAIHMNNVKMEKIKILVTGGCGFLGGTIVKELMDNDFPIPTEFIRIMDIAGCKGEEDRKVEMVKGDVRDYDTVKEACRGIDLVIHSAAIVDWGTRSEKEVMDINLEGTKNVIRACQENGVEAMVFTSSLDAVYSGKPLLDIDENQPYPDRHETVYCTSKHLSEMEVMRAAGPEFKTVIIRPSDIYGENDPYHIGSLIDMAKGGFYVRLGNGRSKCQHTYVGNVANAHLQAGRAILDKNDKVNGNAYFITDGPGANFFKFFDRIVIGSGYRIWPRNLWIPRGLAYAMGSASEFIAFMLRPIKKYHPKFSRFAVIYTCTDFTFTSDKAKKDFGFKIKYPEEVALRRTIEYFKKD